MSDLSYQLYSSREFPPLADTLKMLVGIGYRQVEGFGGVYGDLPALKAALDANGLAMTTGHFGIAMLEDEPNKVMEIAKSVGMEAIYCPHLMPDERPNDFAGWRDFGVRLQKAGAHFKQAGLDFGWHNHDFEFMAMADGRLPIEAIFEGGPDLSWEADIAWIVRGGADPLTWINRYGDRISSVHIKDIAPAGECEDEDGWADVGHGTMDWPGLMAAVKNAPARFFVMEHDKPNDHQRFASRSFTTVSTL